ncbi:MAG: N-acetylglucosamine-6-phosphate deacetylase [Clostridia bacterium]|nr:N-acetylglucosamine-6-phosphate deacetylase [Clostridia bacterium]
MLIQAAKCFTGETFEEVLRVRLENGRVTGVGRELTAQPGERIKELKDGWLLPGLVDVHIHAFMGMDTMQGEEAVRHMSACLFEQGVAAFCPTTMSASEADTLRAVEGIRAVMAKPQKRGAEVLGAHMEAPFLNEEKAGAQRKEFFADPDWAAFERMTGGHPEAVKLITMAPERAGSEAFIRRARAAGVRVSIGHTAADAETVHLAADWGADHVTHTFNAMTSLSHRMPGVPGAALTDDRLYCEMICDGVHLHRDTVRLIARSKGSKKAVAITDAMEAAGLSDGVYALGGQRVNVRGAEARLDDGTLAGSVLTLRRALENLIHLFDIGPADACRMCTSTPAASVGDSRCGRLTPGSPAPLTWWTEDWRFGGIIAE